MRLGAPPVAPPANDRSCTESALTPGSRWLATGQARCPGRGSPSLQSWTSQASSFACSSLRPSAEEAEEEKRVTPCDHAQASAREGRVSGSAHRITDLTGCIGAGHAVFRMAWQGDASLAPGRSRWDLPCAHGHVDRHRRKCHGLFRRKCLKSRRSWRASTAHPGKMGAQAQMGYIGASGLGPLCAVPLV